MNFEEIWDYKLIELDDYSLTAGSILLVILIILVARGIVWMVSRILRSRMRRIKGVDEGRKYAIVSITKYFVYTFAFLLIFESVGVNITVLIAGSTALFVGLGFGLQNTFRDFISGIILLFEGTLQIGDIVKVNGVVGRVNRIGIRTSQIVTRDDISIIVPNSNFVSDNVVNYSHQGLLARFKLQVSVRYGTNVELVRKLLVQAAENHPEVSRKPAPRAIFEDFGDSGLIFDLLFWTEHTFEAEYITSDLRFTINQFFKENDITIPFPQRDVHFFPSTDPLSGPEKS